LHGMPDTLPMTHTTDTLFTRIERQEQAAQESWGVFVPLDDFTVYTMLARETAMEFASRADRKGLVLLVDSVTAAKVETVQRAVSVADHVLCFGHKIPENWGSCPRAVLCRSAQTIGDHDRFLVALATNLSLAVLGSQAPDSARRRSGFHGGWTAQHGVVARIAETIFADCRESPRIALPVSPGLGNAEHPFRVSARLMAHMAQLLSSRQRDITQDKDDLFSVLNIIKAISAKRRAHNILYVFVEQIANIVEMTRCSVVRVWGEEDKGHVLASHEDASVRDLVIDLKKYPEVYRAMETREKIVINDVLNDPLTNAFAPELRRSGISSLIVIPIVLFDQNVGSFFLRAARGNGPFSLREISFCEIVAETAANALERAQLFDSIQRANERLEFLAITDGLTGLYNHRLFYERFEQEFERARRYDSPLSCLILDVDDFKKTNDAFGHLVGDTILREIAARTSQMVRKSDTVARYGGEEFAVIMPQTGLKGAKAQAERIRKEIGNHPYESLPPNERITVSIGVAVFNNETMSDCEALIRAADNALYKAKRGGKNCVVVEESG